MMADRDRQSEVIIRPMTTDDLSRVVQIHQDCFQGFFLSFLGLHFLEELYMGILIDPSGMAFVYEMDKQIQGFVAGTDQPRGFYQRLLRRQLLRFCFASIAPVIKKPSIIPRLFRALTMPQHADAGEGCGTLMSIAVSPEMQSKGAGRGLVNTFLDESTRRGLKQVNLTTDRNDNEVANHFYQQYGFFLYHSYVTPEGREMNEYRIDLPVRSKEKH